MREKADFLMICTYAKGTSKIELPGEDEVRGVQKITGLDEQAARLLIDKLCKSEALSRSPAGDLYLPRFVTIGGTTKLIGELKSGYGNFIRMYDAGVRQIYRDEESREILGYIVYLLKFINVKYNVLCSNPAETSGRLVRPFTLWRISKEFGIEYSCMTAFTGKLLNTTFDSGSGVRRNIFAKNRYAVDGVAAAGVYINPNLFFAGSEKDKKRIIHLFEPETKSTSENEPSNPRPI